MSKKIMIGIGLLLVAILATGGTLVYRQRNGAKNNADASDHSKMAMNNSKPGYSVALLSGMGYLAKSPVMLHFAVKDQNGATVKDFDTVNEKQMHLIVVRKDRINFQHVHPTFDQSNGMFMIEPFTFPADGEYRIFADFTPSNAPKDEMGMKEAVAPYQDVRAGDINNYKPQMLGADKLSSSVNGLDTSFFYVPNADSPGGTTDTSFYAGKGSFVAISVNKNGQPYKKLQPYLGALGHMVILGPNLEFVHAHAQTDAGIEQGGLVTFDVTFPDPGQYKLFLQTKADDMVNTTDYNLTVKPAQ